MDIGGGSLELALSADGLVERLISLPLGAIRVTEQYLVARRKKKRMRKLRKHVRDELREHRLGAALARGAQIIGSGGTFTSLAAIYLARTGMQNAQTVHGHVVPRIELEHIVDMLQRHVARPSDRRVPGLNAARADIIVGGLAVAAEVLARLDAKELVVSAYGIREGILARDARTSSRDLPIPARRASARSRARGAVALRGAALRARSEAGAAALRFDRRSASAARRKIELLADAALLHDIGYHISYDKHHKHSYHLIVHAELLGMTPAEQIVVANVARYHRGAEPKKTHENYGGLDKRAAPHDQAARGDSARRRRLRPRTRRRGRRRKGALDGARAAI